MIFQKQVTGCPYSTGRGVKLYVQVGGRGWRVIYLSYVEFSVRKICLFSYIYLLMQSFTSVWSDAHVFCTVGYNPSKFYYFCCLNCPSFGHWKVFWLSLCPFDIPSFFCFLEDFLAFWHYKLLQVPLVSPCRSPRISHFSKGSWFLSFENDVRS